MLLVQLVRVVLDRTKAHKEWAPVTLLYLQEHTARISFQGPEWQFTSCSHASGRENTAAKGVLNKTTLKNVYGAYPQAESRLALSFALRESGMTISVMKPTHWCRLAVKASSVHLPVKKKALKSD